MGVLHSQRLILKKERHKSDIGSVLSGKGTADPALLVSTTLMAI